MKALNTCVFALFVFFSTDSMVDARVFTDVQGRKIEASLVSVKDGKVELKLDRGGKIYWVPISKFSQTDRDFIKLWQSEQKSDDGEDVGYEKRKESKKLPGRRGRGRGTDALMKQYNLVNNFDAEWPKIVSVDIGLEVDIASEDSENNKFVYHSPNYEFICDVRLSKNVVKKFAILFEATREFCRLLPISSMKAHVPGEQFRNKVLLFESKATYIKNGGPPSSAGVFMSRGGNGVVMAPLSSLGVKKVGSGYMYDYKGSNKVLPHELAHQLTDFEYYEVGASGWFSEGMAEYVANTPYRSGKFIVRSNLSAIKAYATEYGKKGRGGRAMGKEFDCPDLKKYMLQPYSSFTGNANFNYGMGMLLTYYFFHMEDDRSNIVNFLKALKEGKKHQEAIDVLLNGRSYDELEEQVAKAWRSRGVRINFR